MRLTLIDQILLCGFSQRRRPISWRDASLRWRTSSRLRSYQLDRRFFNTVEVVSAIWSGPAPRFLDKAFIERQWRSLEHDDAHSQRGVR